MEALFAGGKVVPIAFSAMIRADHYDQRCITYAYFVLALIKNTRVREVLYRCLQCTPNGSQELAFCVMRNIFSWQQMNFGYAKQAFTRVNCLTKLVLWEIYTLAVYERDE